MDGTPPLRAVLRCVTDGARRLWHRRSEQSLYRPKDLHITHACIYAVDPEFVHLSQLQRSAFTQTLAEEDGFGWKYPTVRTDFYPIHRALTASIIATHKHVEEYPLKSQMVYLHDTLKME